MVMRYYCKYDGRRKILKDPDPNRPKVNGIDYLEVAGADQTTLEIYFLFELPGTMTVENVRIEDGARIKKITIESLSISGKKMTVTVDRPGDFSTHRFRLVETGSKTDPPGGFDRLLSSVDFSFKAACPSDFDCRPGEVCPPKIFDEPEIDYLAKDYAGFRRLMLDRMHTLMQDWREKNPADMQIALVEILAYAADHLSYYQDAVATEAYLNTARKRISIRRHARLLDYFMHDGCNARVWVHVQVDESGSADRAVLDRGTRLLTGGVFGQPRVAPDELGGTLLENPMVFETMHDAKMYSAHNEISFYTWKDDDCCLRPGSTAATLLNEPRLHLEPGDVLIFEEVLDPETGSAADADPNHRQAVRITKATPDEDSLYGTKVLEIEWHKTDALRFPLCLKKTISGGSHQTKPASVARGNVVLADHGLTIPNAALTPQVVPDKGRYSPRPAHTGISMWQKYELEKAKGTAAAEIVLQNPNQALAHMELHQDGEFWTVQRDLLDSERFDAHFVVEIEADGILQLRFGIDVMGKKPVVGTRFVPIYRVGNGSGGNIGRDVIRRIVTNIADITSVRNPLPAVGGTDPETMENVRRRAPQAFRRQERAVTETDYAEVAERHDNVQRAAARFRWTGSWYTLFVSIDRKEGRPVGGDGNFQNDIRRHIGRYRMAGYDLEITDPLYVPLDILMQVCVKPGYFREEVQRLLLQEFSREVFADRRLGFFHPDRFTFGRPLYLSQALPGRHGYSRSGVGGHKEVSQTRTGPGK